MAPCPPWVPFRIRGMSDAVSERRPWVPGDARSDAGASGLPPAAQRMPRQDFKPLDQATVALTAIAKAENAGAAGAVFVHPRHPVGILMRLTVSLWLLCATYCQLSGWAASVVVFMVTAAI